MTILPNTIDPPNQNVVALAQMTPPLLVRIGFMVRLWVQDTLGLRITYQLKNNNPKVVPVGMVDNTEYWAIH
jgi:hypothetical protein